MTEEGSRAIDGKGNPTAIVYNGAVNRINPITGKPYIEATDSALLSKEQKETFFNEATARKTYLYDSLSKLSSSPLTTPLIEMEKALGRMEVRNGRLSERDYLNFVGEVYDLSKKYQETSGLTLASITDATGLNEALLHAKPSLLKEDPFFLKQYLFPPLIKDDFSKNITIK